MQLINKKIETAIASLVEALEESPHSFEMTFRRGIGEKFYRGEIIIKDIPRLTNSGELSYD